MRREATAAAASRCFLWDLTHTRARTTAAAPQEVEVICASRRGNMSRCRPGYWAPSGRHRNFGQCTQLFSLKRARVHRPNDSGSA